MTADKTCAQPLTCGWLQSCKYDGGKVAFLQKTQIRGAFIIFHKRACQAKYKPGWGRGSSSPGSLCSESRRSDPGFRRRPGFHRGSPARPWQVGGFLLTRSRFLLFIEFLIPVGAIFSEFLFDWFRNFVAHLEEENKSDKRCSKKINKRAKKSNVI